MISPFAYLILRIFRYSGKALGDFLKQYKKVRIIGGCCGTNPDHIAIAVIDVEESAKVYQEALGVHNVEFETVESEVVLSWKKEIVKA